MKLPGIFLLLSSAVWGMPSYQDVLLVVKSGDAKSLEVANYFKAARGIPGANVVTLACPGGQGSILTMAERDAFIQGLGSAISSGGLDGKINYIVLSSGFPAKSKDNPAGTAVNILDLVIMDRLSANYPAHWFTNNTYAYIRKNNFTNRQNIKFTKAKYGHYILTRLDGPSVSAIKKMIDSFGPAAYASAAGVKYVVDSQSPNAHYFPQVKANVESRKGSFIYWKTNDGIINNVRDMNFLDCDWVVGADGQVSRGSVISHYPHPFKRLGFKPGSLMNVFRSFPTGNGYFSPGYAGLYSHSGGVLTSRMAADGSDYLFQNISCLAIDENSHQIWCGLGVNPGHSTRSAFDIPVYSSESQMGNGIVVYDKSGNVLKHFTRENTGGGLLANGVYPITFDRFNKRMWV
ncbi:MAG: hypothetical protein JNM63_07105, partial [Spirochaetia bacterium]|nr:hypothetical protein [Spirochaetia bacterium]